jgi:hypothetical protein
MNVMFFILSYLIQTVTKKKSFITLEPDRVNAIIFFLLSLATSCKKLAKIKCSSLFDHFMSDN